MLVVVDMITFQIPLLRTNRIVGANCFVRMAEVLPAMQKHCLWYCNECHPHLRTVNLQDVLAERIADKGKLEVFVKYRLWRLEPLSAFFFSFCDCSKFSLRIMAYVLGEATYKMKVLPDSRSYRGFGAKQGHVEVLGASLGR